MQVVNGKFRLVTGCRICFWQRLLPLLAWCLVVAWLTLTSSLPDMPALIDWDKLHHAIAFGIMAFLLARFVAQVMPQSSISIILGLTWLACMGGGVFLEFMQFSMGSGRSADVWDVVANGVGISAICYGLLKKPMQRFYLPIN